MNIELEKKLFNNFPLLYGDKDESIQVSLIPFGFECNDGWYQIIYDLSSKLEQLIKKFILENPNCGNNYPRASQVKEKYGELSFYMTFGTKEMNELISETENLSSTICEYCGKQDSKLRNLKGWYTTLCNECYENSIKRMKKCLQEPV